MRGRIGRLRRRARAGQLKEVIHGVAEFLRLFQGGPRITFGLVRCRALQRLQTEAQRGQSPSQLMRCIRGEIALGLNELVDAISQTIQGVSNGIDFRHSGKRRSPRQVTGAHLVCGGGHRGQGRGQPAGLPPRQENRDDDDEQTRQADDQHCRRCSLVGVVAGCRQGEHRVIGTVHGRRDLGRESLLRSLGHLGPVGHDDSQTVTRWCVGRDLVFDGLSFEDLLGEVLGERLSLELEAVVHLGMDRPPHEKRDRHRDAHNRDEEQRASSRTRGSCALVSARLAKSSS